ncbi:hypothetical protein [Aeromicrobium sp. UC242_57]|uniref:hypothetical protein n=1 Tax=Aeromicrobium sp. UC242_57 TaxID=3374624 RepID=UPI003798873D
MDVPGGSRDRWNWSFGAGFPLASVVIGGSAGSNLTTYEFGADTAYRRLWTYESSRNNYVRGFNFGQYGYGTTSADSYIFSSAGGGQYGTPFSQVFIRPKLMSSDLTFAPISASGTPAETIRAVPKNGSLTSSWGVSGIGNGGSSENASEVQAFAQIGSTMYVGGNFTTVLKGADATGSDRVSQPYLAAFNATTGDYIRSFAPRLNSQVKALKALPNGKLAVGGEFTQVDGTARTGLVVLDPTTGALDPTWTTNLQNNSTGGTVSVRGLDTDGTYLYLTGAFTHFVRTGTTTRYAKGGARILLSTGVADGAGIRSSTTPAPRSTSATTSPGSTSRATSRRRGAARQPIVRPRSRPRPVRRGSPGLAADVQHGRLRPLPAGHRPGGLQGVARGFAAQHVLVQHLDVRVGEQAHHQGRR